MNKLDMKQFVCSVDIFMAIVYVVCRFFYAVLPDQSVAVANTVFHGIQSSVKAFTRGDSLLGLVETLVMTTIAAALFVWIYNWMAKK